MSGDPGVSCGAGEGVCVSERSSVVSTRDRAARCRRRLFAGALRHRERRGHAAGRAGDSGPQTQGHPHRCLRRGIVFPPQHPLRHRHRRPAEDRESVEIRVCVGSSDARGSVLFTLLFLHRSTTHRSERIHSFSSPSANSRPTREHGGSTANCPVGKSTCY